MLNSGIKKLSTHVVNNRCLSIITDLNQLRTRREAIISASLFLKAFQWALFSLFIDRLAVMLRDILCDCFSFHLVLICNLCLCRNRICLDGKLDKLKRKP